jgi:hypothetical protein
MSEIPEDLDLVVSARPAAAGVTFGELQAEFGKALSRIAGTAERRPV